MHPVVRAFRPSIRGVERLNISRLENSCASSCIEAIDASHWQTRATQEESAPYRRAQGWRGCNLLNFQLWWFGPSAFLAALTHRGQVWITVSRCSNGHEAFETVAIFSITAAHAAQVVVVTVVVLLKERC